MSKTYPYKAYVIVDGTPNKQKVTATIHRKFLCFVLAEWSQGTRWAHPEPYTFRQVVRWLPIWRVLPNEPTKEQGEVIE